MKYGFTLLTALLGTLAWPASAQSLNLDELDKAVAADRLCTAGFNPVFGWFEQSSRLGVQEVANLQPGSCTRITTANLRARLGGLDLPLADALVYSLSGSTVTVPLLEPALCEDYYSATGPVSWTHSILDANGDRMLNNNVRGLASMSYAVSSGLFTPTMVSGYGNTQWLRCYSGLAPNMQIAEADPEEIFADGFELDADVPQLRVQILDAAGNQPLTLITHTPTLQAQYKVRISNLGRRAATDVRIREFVPSSSDLMMPLLTRTSCTAQPGVTGLALGPACGGSASSGEKTLFAKLSTLAPGASVEFDVARKSNAPIDAEAQALVQYAVFSAPANGVESEYRDNSYSARIKVVNNTAPVITCSGLPNTVQLTENQDPVSYQCSITDAEGDTVTNITAQSSNPSLLAASVARVGSTNDFTLTLTPQPDAFGGPTTVTVTAVAPPVNGTLSFAVQIEEFNDPPTFDLAGQNVLLMPNNSVGTHMSPQHYNGSFYQNVNKGANCDDATSTRCDLTFLSFITNASPGPGEDHQTIGTPTVDCTLNDGGRAVRMFGTFPTFAPRTGTSGAYNLSLSQYKHDNASIPDIEVTCTIRVTDSGGASTEKNVLFKYKTP